MDSIGLVNFSKCRSCGKSGIGVSVKGIGGMHVNCAIDNIQDRIDELHGLFNTLMDDMEKIKE